MTITRKSIVSSAVLIVVLGLSGKLLAQGSKAAQNAVVKSYTNKVNTQPSASFVDASVYIRSDGMDMCKAINDILTNNWTTGNSNGVVIDARGFSSPTCTINPWSGLSGIGTFVNTVLLPAATIMISHTWIPIASTKIIGEGPNVTILQAASNFQGDMIEMGGAVACPLNNNNDCESLVVEHLGLKGGVNGIVNDYSQELSEVSDVAFTNMTGTGLTLGVNCGGPSGCSNFSSNSGPYSNISYTGSGPCLLIAEKNPTQGTNSLRGVHGLTCTTSHDPAIYLDGSNTTLEDITINGLAATQVGIVIGSDTAQTAAGAYDDVLLNIRGTGSLTTLIHICGLNASGACVVSTIAPVSDLSMVGVTNLSCATGCPGGSAITIQDDLTVTTLSDVYVGMYALGEPLSVGYSRFTTSLNFPSWLTGTTPPGNSCPAGATGSFYSCTTTSNNCGTGTTKTLWVCVGQTWVGIK